MIINVEQIREDNGNTYTYYFKEEGDSRIIAYATNESSDLDRYLYFNDKEYLFADKLSFIETCNLPELKWEVSDFRGKSLCRKVYEDGEYVAQNHAVTLKSAKPKRKNFNAEVYEYGGRHYTVYKVGFSNEPCHYYCIYDDTFKCMGIVERNYGCNIRCRIYIEDERNLLIALIVCMEETVCAFRPSSDRDTRRDRSSGNYISICEDEKELLDREFLKRVRMQEELKSSDWLADKVVLYDDAVIERSKMLEEINEKVNKATTPVFALVAVLMIVFTIAPMLNFLVPTPVIIVVMVIVFIVWVRRKNDEIKKEVKEKRRK